MDRYLVGRAEAGCAPLTLHQGTHVIEGVPYAIARGDVYVMGLDTTHYYTRCRDLVVQNFFSRLPCSTR